MWYIYAKEYYLAIKRNEIRSLAEKWMDLETHTEGSKSERIKQILYYIFVIYIIIYTIYFVY